MDTLVNGKMEPSFEDRETHLSRLKIAAKKNPAPLVKDHGVRGFVISEVGINTFHVWLYAFMPCGLWGARLPVAFGGAAQVVEWLIMERTDAIRAPG
jgi:hypothetical protein